VPGQFGACRTRLDRADTILPAVSGDKIATWIAQNRHTEAAQRIEHVLTEAVCISQRRVGFVYPTINATTEVFSKSAKNVTVNRSKCTIQVNANLIHRGYPLA